MNIENISPVLNDDQRIALKKMIDFVNNEGMDEAFILLGSAGTGKTTLLKIFSEHLKCNNIYFHLLAPTGRAAKVLADKTGNPAKTMHSFLYTLKEVPNGEQVKFQFILRNNPLPTKSIIIIDEASMLSNLPSNNELFISTESVLCDLISYFRTCPKGSKLLFVGDKYQLPPIDESRSACLDKASLQAKYNMHATSFELSIVMRQKSDSYILENASLIKHAIDLGYQTLPILKYNNLYKTELAIEQYISQYDITNPENQVFIAWKNRCIDKLNIHIRNKLFNNPNLLLCSGEHIILHRSALKKQYLSSGEFGKIIEFQPDSIEVIADHTFATAVFQFTNYTGGVIEFESKFEVDTLLETKHSVSQDKINLLWSNRKKNNRLFRETNNIQDDEYLNALKVGYSYAITAHKAQGGEWNDVFLYPELPNENNLNWLYTVITRAKKTLYSY